MMKLRTFLAFAGLLFFLSAPAFASSTHKHSRVHHYNSHVKYHGHHATHHKHHKLA